jgi:hypothetical protein
VKLAAFALLLVGCAAPAPTSTHPPIEATYRARCGSCHIRIEPGSHSREALEEVFKRHRNRVRLTETQWGEMVDFLAASDGGAPASSVQ